MSTLRPLNSPERQILWFRFLACCFAAIFGFRAFLIEKYGASIARVDEWEATGKEVIAAWRNGTFSWAALFEAHNGDHRIVATRLWEIFWYNINGAWDPKLVMTAKAVIYAAAATVFIHLLVGALPRRRFVAGALLAGLFAFPFGYQNLLWAFQSQFDFFLLTVALGWLALLSGRAVLALIAAAVAPFTLGAGAVIAASYMIFFAAALATRRWPRRRVAGFTVAAMIIAVMGVSLRGGHAAPLGAPGDQARALFTIVAWPHSNLFWQVYQLPESARLIPAPVLNFPEASNSWLMQIAQWLHLHPNLMFLINGLFGIIAVAPTLLLIAESVGRRRFPPADAWGPLCVAGLAFLLQVASAIARSNEAIVPIRYIDVVMLAGFAALASAFVVWRVTPRWRPLLVAWVLIVAPGYLATMGASLIRLEHREPQRWVTTLQRYFPTHDHSLLPENTAWQLPIFEKDPSRFMALLDDPDVEAVLPQSLTAPERPLPAAAYVASLVGKSGLLIVLLAASGAGWAAFHARRTRNEGAIYVAPNAPSTSA